MLCRGISPAMWLSLAILISAEPSPHKTWCDDRPCRPGEGNPVVTHSNNPYETPGPPDFIKTPPHTPDPTAPHYAPLVATAKAVAHAHHHLVYMCAADFDYRELAMNWWQSLQRQGLHNGFVYALDGEVHEYLKARQVPVVDGSANLDAWNRTRVTRHIQRAEAERHMAAAAVAAAGLDVLLMEATMVMVHDPSPTLHDVARSGVVDTAVPRCNCNGAPPLGCKNPCWNLVFLRGAGSAEQRERAVAWQLAGIRKGMVDFYLRWWLGAHCFLAGFGKRFGECMGSGRLEGALVEGGGDGVTIDNSSLTVKPEYLGGDAAKAELKTAVVVATLPHCLEGGGGGLRLGLLPESFFNAYLLFSETNPSQPAGALQAAIARSPKPVQRDRLKLDRYDEQDFVEMTTAMKRDGLWFL